MKRIVIQLSALSKERWNLIYRFIEKCNGRGVFGKDLFGDLTTVATIVIDDNPDVSKDAATIEGLRVFDYGEFSSVDEETVISILYKKTDEQEEFSDLPPFFLLKKQFGNKLTLGIDVGRIIDKQSRYDYVFQCSIFLYFIKDKQPLIGKHSVYFINVNSEGIFPDNSVSSLRYKKTLPDYKNASPFIIPLLHVNINTFGIFDSGYALDDNVRQYIEYSIDNIRKRLGSREVDLEGCNSLFERWFVLSYRLVSTEDDAGFQTLKILLLEYCHNIFELVQNILFHAQEKRGLLYVVFSKKDKIRTSTRNRILDFDSYTNNSHFLEYGIYDYGNKGIVDTFCEENENELLKMSLSLAEFFNPQQKISGPISAHLGIRSFVNSIIDHNGCFRIETNESDANKQILEFSGRYLSQPSHWENINGTHYDVIMPVDCHKQSASILQYESVFRCLKADIVSARLILEMRSKAIEELARQSFPEKPNQEESVDRAAKEILQEIAAIRQKREKETTSLIGIAVDLKDVNIRPNILYKLIDGLKRTNKEVNAIGSDFCLVFTNLPEETICVLCENYLSSISKLERYIPSYPVVLLGEKWQIQILYGSTRAELLYVNRRIHAFYFANDEYAKQKDYFTSTLSGLALESAEKLVLPYDVLINKANGENLFTSLISRSMDVPIGEGEKDTGCLLMMPTRIGNKIYVDHYYEADYLFQNTFFTDRFGFFIAKVIVEKCNLRKPGFERKIVLIGYNPYSGPLTERVRDYVNSAIPDKIAGAVVAKEDDAAKRLDFKMTETLKNDIRHNSSDYGFITIVPIASTLSTNDKISTLFKRRMPDGIEILFVYNFVTLLVRDRVQEKCSPKEEEWKWKQIKGHTISTSFQEDYRTGKDGMRVDFLVQKEGIWHSLIDEKAFPNEWWKEVYINQTRNASLNTKDLLGYPVVAMPSLGEMRDELGLTKEADDDAIVGDYFKLSVEKMWGIRDSILFGHIVHNEIHYRFYFDVEQVFESLTKEDLDISASASLDDTNHKKRNSIHSFNHIKKWLHYLRGKIERGCLNVIVTPDNDSESCYVNTINKFVFDDNAVVIYLNFTDPRQNSRQKLSFLKQSVLTRNAHFYYVDQALLTGESYHNAKVSVASILGKNDFCFEGIITFINRLSKERYDEIKQSLNPLEGKDKHIYSFVHFFMIPSSVYGTGCYLCNLHEHFGVIKRYSDIKDCRTEIERNRSKYHKTPFSHYLNDEFSSGTELSKPVTCIDNRAWRRMLWIHQLSFEIAVAKGSSNVADIIKKLYRELDQPARTKGGRKRVSIVDNKISFLKAISYPPLSHYAPIRACGHELQLSQLHETLSAQDPGIDDFNLMLALLKHLAILGSNALVRRDVLVGSWNLYVRVRSRLPFRIMKSDQFISRYLFFVKVASYKDEAKSLWLGELLRTGREMDASRRINISSTSLFNEFFNLFRTKAKFFRQRFIPQLYFDNTAITRKTLNTLELALKRDSNLKKLYYDGVKLLSFADICKNINDIVLYLRERIDSEYVYSWFRLYLDKNNKTADGIPILERIAYILYARLLLRGFMDSSKQNFVSFDKNAELLLEVATKILDANASFVSIKTEKGLEPLVTLTTYNIKKAIQSYEDYYCQTLVTDSVTGKGRPFVIMRDICNTGEEQLGNFSRAAYLMLEVPRTVASKTDRCVGVVTFLYQAKTDDDAFMINTQESGRLLLLLKPEVDEYAKHIADEKQFEVWKEKMENQTRFERVYANSNHIFRSVFEQMDEFENVKYDILTNLNLDPVSLDSIEDMNVVSFTDTWFWLTNEMISYIYANIERHHKGSRHYLSLDKGEKDINQSHNARELFSGFFIKMLKSLLGGRWSGQCIMVNGRDISVEKENSIGKAIPDVTITCNKHLMQTFIVQCLNNSLRSALEVGGHNNCEKKRVWITVDGQAVTIKDEVLKGETPDEKEISLFEKKKKMIRKMDCQNYSCTTLTSLQGFVNHMRTIEGKAFDCSYGYDKENLAFEVKIFFNHSE